MSDSDLYTIFVTGEQRVTTKSGVETRQMMFVYYDVQWKQISFYSTKHGAQHVTIEQQSKRLDRAFEIHTIDELNWSEEALRNTITREPSIDRAAIGGVAQRKPVRGMTPSDVALTAAKISSGERVRIDAGYADLVNALIKES